MDCWLMRDGGYVGDGCLRGDFGIVVLVGGVFGGVGVKLVYVWDGGDEGGMEGMGGGGFGGGGGDGVVGEVRIGKVGFWLGL